MTVRIEATGKTIALAVFGRDLENADTDALITGLKHRRI